MLCLSLLISRREQDEVIGQQSNHPKKQKKKQKQKANRLYISQKFTITRATKAIHEGLQGFGTREEKKITLQTRLQ